MLHYWLKNDIRLLFLYQIHDALNTQHLCIINWILSANIKSWKTEFLNIDY